MDVNNEIRPSLPPGEVEQTLARLLHSGCTIRTTVRFAGWVQSIDSEDAAILNDLRLLHHIERYWFAADLLKPLGLRNICVVDIGIGEAHGILQFLKNVPDGTIRRTVGIEVDKEAAQRAKAEFPFLEIIHANVVKLALEDSFDVVFCYELMGNESIGSDEVLLQQLDKLCAPGGRIFLSIAAFGNTAAGRTRAKNYSARIYDSRGFIRLANRVLSGYQFRFFGQIYPLKRMFQGAVGVWENPELKQETDFLICVATKNGCRALDEKGSGRGAW